MKKNKADFIADLLRQKKMSTTSKDRAFRLTVQEINKLEGDAAEIYEELVNLRDNAFHNAKKEPLPASTGNFIKTKIDLTVDEKVDAISTDEIGRNIDNGPHRLPIHLTYVNPRNTANFLLAYNQNIFLKSTTHNIDSNLLLSINEYLNINSYNFSLHLDAIQNAFYAIYERYKPINHGLYGKVVAYLFGNKPWTINNIIQSWASADLKIWAEKNDGMCPNPESDVHSDPYSFGRLKLPDGTSIKNQCELVLYFKNQVTVRSSNSLFDLCAEWNFRFREKVVFDLAGMPKSIEFFTDVEKLQQAYTKIISLFIECSGSAVKPIISLTMGEQIRNGEKVIVFSITHKNSVFQRTIDSTITRYGKTFTELIKNQINGLCDWEISAEFEGNQYGKLSIWPWVNGYTPLNSFNGVQYDLIFYK
jgi:hypothetical protein